MKHATKIALMVLFSTLCLASASLAAVVGRFTVVEGRVDLLAPGEQRAAAVRAGDPVSEGDIIRTKSGSFAEVVFIDAAKLRIAESSRAEVRLYDIQNGKRKSGSINLIRGKVRATVPKTLGSILPAAFRPKPSFEITTETAAAGVRGTDFIVSHSMGTTAVFVLSGLVETRNLHYPEQIIPVSAGFRTIVHQNETPSAIMPIGHGASVVMNRTLEAHERSHREDHASHSREAEAKGHEIEHTSYERHESGSTEYGSGATESEHHADLSSEIITAPADEIAHFEPETQQIAENIVERPVSETNPTVLSQTTSTSFDAPGSMNLTWTASVNLNAYLFVPQGGGHTAVNASNLGAAGAPLYSVLARDITTGGGTETINIERLLDGTYYYSVHNASGSGIAGTDAQVTVISQGSTIQTHNVPATGAGQWWNVIKIEGGKVETINSVDTQAPVTP